MLKPGKKIRNICEAKVAMCPPLIRTAFDPKEDGRDSQLSRGAARVLTDYSCYRQKLCAKSR